jgi:glucose-6-phosphate dehydrogenase assembly protein OpcA
VNPVEGVWSAENTSPADIEAALRELLKERHAEDQAYVPARVLNLVLVVDREWRGEIVNRLERVGRYHPSRTVLCEVEAGRTTLDARATMIAKESDGLHVAQERIEIMMGTDHLPALDSIVDPLVVTDLATLVWSPHGHPIESIMKLAQVVLLDSLEAPDMGEAVRRATAYAEQAYVVDLAWLRTTPWRERISATFDPPAWRNELGKVSGVTVHHRPDSAVSGLLLFGWLASRLGWEPGALMKQNGTLLGRARGKRQEVELRLEPVLEQNVPGLAGLTIETASGMSLSLDRGSGGLSARRRTRDGNESAWTVMGASRGEAGILGEGIRQALLRDPTYRPALAAAGAMLA